MHIKAKSVKRIDPHLLKLYKRCGCRFDKLLEKIIGDHDSGCGCVFCAMQSAEPIDCDYKHCAAALIEYYKRQEDE